MRAILFSIIMLQGFILMGSSHTAFFNDFKKRSPKYELVNILDYLK